MKVVMTLMAWNEADIIEANLAFHLSAGVDFVIATDNGSDDGTAEILQTYAQKGYLLLIRQPERVSQEDQMTHMARLAATEFGADWVINTDADEFWWPRGGSLKEVLDAVPPRFGSVRGMWRHFLPRPADSRLFAEQMTVRSCAPLAHGLDPHFKTAHRADPEVTIGGGNHEASGPRLFLLRGWYPIDVLHFPIRSIEQSERKFVRWWKLVSEGGGIPAPYVTEAYNAHREGRMAEYYDSRAIDDDKLEAGLRNGTLALDTRLRDYLRSLGSESGDPMHSVDAHASSFTDVRVDEAYVAELATLESSNAVVRAQQRLDALEKRASALEAGPAARIRSRLAALRKR
jgi:glycosyltransferase involved in cell wall biosynthesis